MLSDDVLIHIFYLNREASEFSLHGESWSWHQWCAFAHVCQRWRRIIFAWPNYLNIRIDCTSRTAAVKALDVWPALPISIHSVHHIKGMANHEDRDSIIDILEHRDRIVGIDLLGLTRPQLETCAVLMQESFSILRALSLSCDAEIPLVISDMFLGGSAPRLQSIKLQGIPFPTLPIFLLSTRDLVELHLDDIPRTGYISPDVMVTSLAILTRLRSVTISFLSKSSFPKNPTTQSPLPQTRTVLPSLAALTFGGVGKYLEDFMARIDAPLLNDLHLDFYQPTFGIPQLTQIIHRIEDFKTPHTAEIDFYDYSVDISLTSKRPIGSHFHLEFDCDGIDKQLSLLEQIFSQCSPLLSHIHTLEIFDHDMQPHQDSALWLPILRPFNGVQTLIFYDQDSVVQVARVLGELAEENAGEALPMLRAFGWFGGCNWDEIAPQVTPLLQPFIDARELLGHPVEVP